MGRSRPGMLTSQAPTKPDLLPETWDADFTGAHKAWSATGKIKAEGKKSLSQVAEEGSFFFTEPGASGIESASSSGTGILSCQCDLCSQTETVSPLKTQVFRILIKGAILQINAGETVNFIINDYQETHWRDFLVVGWLRPKLSCRGAWVLSLAGDLRSHVVSAAQPRSFLKILKIGLLWWPRLRLYASTAGAPGFMGSSTCCARWPKKRKAIHRNLECP